MGRRKKTDPPVEKIATFVEMDFVGGPRDGKSLRLVNPPPPMVRLAFPEWATYETRDGKLHYIGDVRVDEGIKY